MCGIACTNIASAGNTVSGCANAVSGVGNTVSGNFNHVVGHSNVVSGNMNPVYVVGDANTVSGNANEAAAANNCRRRRLLDCAIIVTAVPSDTSGAAYAVLVVGSGNRVVDNSGIAAINLFNASGNQVTGNSAVGIQIKDDYGAADAVDNNEVLPRDGLGMRSRV